MDKDREKRLRNQYRNNEQLQARKSLGLFPDQLRELPGSPANSLDGLGIPCDHTLSRTRQRAEKAGLDAAAVVRGVNAFGGYRDCEVLMNVTPDKFGCPDR